jgi:putative CocE/NonD family hydrolase
MKKIIAAFGLLFIVAASYSQLYIPDLLCKETASLTMQASASLWDTKYITTDSILIRTRDGATISAVIVRKKDLVIPSPVVFIFNIYADPFNDRAEAWTAASKNYVGIVADTRGKKLSPQEIQPFEHDANDAYDIIDWISKQPWCNGKIGMYGGSYLGFTQWAALKKIHPALKTIVPQAATAPGIDWGMWNGVFMSEMLRWIHIVTSNKFTDYTDYNNVHHWDSVFTKWYSSGQSFKSLDSVEGNPSKIFQRWLQHPAYDSYWQKMIPYKEEFSKINIPILSITGYFDRQEMGALYYVKQHYQYNKNANHYLVIGPYDHEGVDHFPKTNLLNYTIDSVARINFDDLVFGWLDYILKDSSKPALLREKINYEVMGANQWKHSSSFRKMNNDTLVFYLNNIKEGDHYTLLHQKPARENAISQSISYKNISAVHSDYDKTIVDSFLKKNGRLVFVSKPFEKKITINGAFTANIISSINKKDIDLDIGLYEQTPYGNYFNLGYFYVLRASHAKDRSKRQLLHPGKKEIIPVTNTFFTCKQLHKGSRLIVLLGMNKNPDWEINYGTGKNVSDETIKDGAIPLQVKWYNSSYIKIPVLK